MGMKDLVWNMEEEYQPFSCGECHYEFMVDFDNLKEVRVCLPAYDGLYRKIVCPYCGTVMFVAKGSRLYSR